MAQPSISCVVVADGARPADIARLAADFASQVYANKELVVVVGDGDEFMRLEPLLKDADRATLVFNDKGVGKSSGVRNNAALEYAQHDLVTFWLPRDRQHPHRLACQAGYVSSGDAGCCLTDRLVYFPLAGDVYWADFRVGPAQGCGGMIPATFLGWRRPSLKWPDSNDPAGLFFAASAHGHISPAQEEGHLTVYNPGREPAGVYERAIVDVKRRGFSAHSLGHRKETLAVALAAYQGDTVRTVSVKAADGSVAFQAEFRS